MASEYLCHVAPRLSLDGDGEPDALLHHADLVWGHAQLSHLGGHVQRPLLGHYQEVAVRAVEACEEANLQTLRRASFVFSFHILYREP